MGDFDVLPLELGQLLVIVILRIYKVIVGFIYGANDFIELEMDRHGIAVLRVLDEEDHQKRDDGGAGVDHQLPGFGEFEERPRYRPDQDDPQHDHEGLPLACRGRDHRRPTGKSLCHVNSPARADLRNSVPVRLSRRYATKVAAVFRRALRTATDAMENRRPIGTLTICSSRIIHLHGAFLR